MVRIPGRALFSSAPPGHGSPPLPTHFGSRLLGVLNGRRDLVQGLYSVFLRLFDSLHLPFFLQVSFVTDPGIEGQGVLKFFFITRLYMLDCFWHARFVWFWPGENLSASLRDLCLSDISCFAFFPLSDMSVLFQLPHFSESCLFLLPQAPLFVPSPPGGPCE